MSATREFDRSRLGREAYDRYRAFEAHAARQRAERLARLPEPMPGRTKRGRRVWFHFDTMRWERHP